MEKKRRKNENKINQGSVAAPPDKETQPIITLYDNNNIPQHRENASPINLLKQKGFSEDAAYDLIASGLDISIIEEAGIRPAVEKEIIKDYHIPIVDRNSHIKKFFPLYLIPYPIVDIKDQNKMVRVKVKPNPSYLQSDPSIQNTKYLQPSKEHLHYGSHLYILPSEIKKLESPKCNLIIVEGEKKTLKVIQELRRLEGKIGKFAVIGIAGVNNWLNAPEWDLFEITGKKVIIFFDADSQDNTAVVEAEIQLTGFLYHLGASQVSSAKWDINRGKGIDDYLVQESNPYALQILIQNAQDTISLYRATQRLQDIDIVQNFFLRVIELQPSLSDASLESLAIIMDRVGIKSKIVRSGIKTARTEVEKRLIKKYKERIKEVFGVENIQVPKDFLWEGGFLKTKKGKIITEFFIIKSIVESIKDLEAFRIKTIRGKEFIYERNEDIKQLFLRHGVLVGDITLPLISEYIMEYTYLNQANIEVEKIAKQVGWHEDKDGNLIYIAPQTIQGYIFDDSLKGYTASGEKEKEKETVIKILSSGSILGIGYLGAVASLLVKPLEKAGAKSFAIFLEGTAGAGKTTTAKFGLSLFGNPEELATNMNTTTVGAEILFASRKDSLVLLDEINTGSYNVSEQLVKFIYDFDSGKGRSRSTIKLNLRKHFTYKGVVFFTSETSFIHLLDKVDKTAMGAYRRSIVVNFSGKNINKQDIQAIYSTILQHHGNLLKDITDYIATNIDTLEATYVKYREQFSSPIYKFKGQENHFALLYTAIDVLENVLGISLSDKDQQTITDALSQLVEENREEYQEKTEINREKLEHLIKDFILDKISHFPTGMENFMPQSIYGKRDGDTLYITQRGLEKLSKEIKIDIKTLKKILVDFGMVERGGDRLLKRTMFSIAGENFYAYKIQFQLSDGTEEKEENQNQDINQDDIAI
jgi:hypothetical protein